MAKSKVYMHTFIFFFFETFAASVRKKRESLDSQKLIMDDPFRLQRIYV